MAYPWQAIRIVIHCRPKDSGLPMYLLQKRDPWVEPNPGMWITFGGYYKYQGWGPAAMARYILGRELFGSGIGHFAAPNVRANFRVLGEMPYEDAGRTDTALYLLLAMPYRFSAWGPVLWEGAGLAWFGLLELTRLNLYQLDRDVLSRLGQREAPELHTWLKDEANNQEGLGRKW